MATVSSAIAAAGKSGVNPAFKSYWANIIKEALSRTIDPQSAVEVVFRHQGRKEQLWSGKQNKTSAQTQQLKAA